MRYSTAGKILVVDDESQNVEVFRRLMTRLGYEVLTASDGNRHTEQSAAQKAGIDRGTPFVQKPFTAAELVRQVREVLDR